MVLVATALTVQVNAAPPADPPPPAWTIVASPNVSGRDNQLYGVSAVSANDVWAVGKSAVTTTPLAAWTLTQHWNGTSWSEVSSPSPSQWHTLTGVAARATDDVWAVGYFSGGSGSSMQSLILHWDGSAWSQVASPNSGSYTYLYAVAARASDDAWAVGSTGAATLGGAMIIAHWDGSSWNLVTNLLSSGSTANMLTGVAALAANDVWAVGYYYLSGRFYPLFEHWNGSAWSIVPGPNLGTGVDGFLQSVTMLATDNVWAVGQTYVNTYHSFVVHWDGTAWSQVTSPSPNVKDFLSGVAASGPNEIWAVGRSDLGGTPDIWQTFTIIKNATNWSGVSSPNPAQATFSQLDGVTAVGAANSWAVGSYHTAQGPWQTLIEHYSTDTPTPTPTATPTSTPTPTPCCTNWSGCVSVGCSINQLSGLFSITYQAEIDNNCAYSMNAIVTHYLQLSTNGITWDNWVQTTPRTIAFQPSPPTTVLNDSFDDQSIPGSYSFYRVWSQVAPEDGCEVFDFYSVAHPICQFGQDQPLDVCAAPITPTPHPYTVSYYEGTIDQSIHMAQGCAARRRGEQGAVVLDYGSPRILGTPGGQPTYAAGLLRPRNAPAPTAPANLGQIQDAVEAYAAGYYKYEGCPPWPGTGPSPTPATASLKIIVGTSNSYLVQSGANGTPTYVPNLALTDEHGTAWAQMVVSIDHDMDSSGFAGVTIMAL